MADATTTAAVIPTTPEPGVREGLRLAVSHRTVYDYLTPVTHSVNMVRLEPGAHPHQKTLSCFIRVLPATRLRRFTDLLGNPTHQFEIQSPHARLVIESHLKVVTGAVIPHDWSLEAPIGVYLDHADAEMLWPYRQESMRVSRSPEIWRTALDACDGRQAVHHQALGIMGWIHENFIYDPGVTEVHAHVEESFSLRRGVCQDFTHVMLAMCRSLGIAARYVSGYLYNGGGDLLGSQASHAWCEVFLPGSGWIGYDPTNHTVTDERHIKVAVGRDYEDVAPIEGGYHGIGSSRMEVSVVISPCH